MRLSLTFRYINLTGIMPYFVVILIETFILPKLPWRKRRIQRQHLPKIFLFEPPRHPIYPWLQNRSSYLACPLSCLLLWLAWKDNKLFFSIHHWALVFGLWFFGQRRQILPIVSRYVTIIWGHAWCKIILTIFFVFWL